jgi:hypothetical protein
MSTCASLALMSSTLLLRYLCLGFYMPEKIGHIVFNTEVKVLDLFH